MNSSNRAAHSGTGDVRAASGAPATTVASHKTRLAITCPLASMSVLGQEVGGLVQFAWVQFVADPPAGIHPRDSSKSIVITPVLGLRTDSLGLGGYVPWPDIVGLDHRCKCLTWLISVHRTWPPPLDAGRVPRLAVLTRDHDFALTIHPGSVARQAPGRQVMRHAANQPGSGIVEIRS